MFLYEGVGVVEKGCLYIVATPIGNLGDMTPRGIDVLSAVDVVACEDTRHSAKLLRHFAITTPTLAYHEHNERQLCHRLVERMQQGETIALVSDAGTPLVSDPGFQLVRAAREAGIVVMPVPGPCALIAALSSAGLPSDRFIFEGFLPAKSGARRQKLEVLANDVRTLVFYESTHRIENSLLDMIDIFGAGRSAVLARELSKRFETILSGSLAELSQMLVSDTDQCRGEFVVLVHGADAADASEISDEARHTLAILMVDLPLKQAAALTAKITGDKKNVLYRLGLAGL